MENCFDFVGAVDSSHVMIMLDTFHMNIEENNLAAAIRQALRDINYQNAVVMEPFVMSGGTIGSEIKVWRDLVPDVSEEMLDHDVKGALQFVRHVFEC